MCLFTFSPSLRVAGGSVQNTTDTITEGTRKPHIKREEEREWSVPHLRPTARPSSRSEAMRRLIGSALLAVASYLAACADLASILFARPGSKRCVPDDELGHGPAAPLREVSAEEIAAFQRDGSVILRGILPAMWVRRLHALVDDVFSHPNAWDVLYSRFVANFYCAQKAILVHHTSQCGRQIAEAAPTTAIAAALLGSASLRVCEPTDALANFHQSVWWGLDGCGTTGYHTDDAYIPVRRRDPTKAAIVRLWMPLARFSSSRHFLFATLNESALKREERARHGVAPLNGTQYATHQRLVRSGVLNHDGQVIKAEEYVPGDILAFAGETPHTAEALDCSPAAGHCLRLILSFAGDNALFTEGRKTGLIPVLDNQTHGAPLNGRQFPTAFPLTDDVRWEWDGGFRPSVSTLVGSFAFALRAGSASFSGSSIREALRYVARTAYFASPLSGYALGLWDTPGPGEGPFPEAPISQQTSKREISLLRHFGGILVGGMLA